jgi:hypothetical protein
MKTQKLRHESEKHSLSSQIQTQTTVSQSANFVKSMRATNERCNIEQQKELAKKTDGATHQEQTYWDRTIVNRKK